MDLRELLVCLETPEMAELVFLAAQARSEKGEKVAAQVYPDLRENMEIKVKNIFMFLFSALLYFKNGFINNNKIGDIGGRCSDCRPGGKGDKGERGFDGLPGNNGKALFSAPSCDKDNDNL